MRRLISPGLILGTAFVALTACNDPGAVSRNIGAISGSTAQDFHTPDSSRSDGGKIADDGKKHISETRVISEIITSFSGETVVSGNSVAERETQKDKRYLENER